MKAGVLAVAAALATGAVAHGNHARRHAHEAFHEKKGLYLTTGSEPEPTIVTTITGSPTSMLILQIGIRKETNKLQSSGTLLHPPTLLLLPHPAQARATALSPPPALRQQAPTPSQVSQPFIRLPAPPQARTRFPQPPLP
jgi:hypothetical protein